MSAGYVELHAKSFYSFGTGASHVHELLAQARDYGYTALALTDSNLCGGLEFARLAESLDIQPITGAELTLHDGSRLTLLARTREGYGNLCRLFTLANAHDRREPRLDPAQLPAHAAGLVLLSGGRGGPLSRRLREGRRQEAATLLGAYRECFGADAVYVELQQNYLAGDSARNDDLLALARHAGAPVIASNDVHYHVAERYRLQHALVAARHNTTIDRALAHIRPNPHLCLKSGQEMMRLFHHCPEAVHNTLRLAEQCRFNLATDLGYTLPEPAVPPGHTPATFLKKLCLEAAVRRYGAVSERIRARLEEEFLLIRQQNLAGFLLLYRDIALLARRIMEEKGLVPVGTPLEERPPGRGRGSSVAMLVGYLIGISHVDPLQWDLTLERFISEDSGKLPDIDLDFPRSIRDELIERVHRHFGPGFAVLTGAVATYRLKGVIQDLGKALGLPGADLSLLSRQLQAHDAASLEGEMAEHPAFRDRLQAPGWRDLLQLAPQLMGAPKGLGQHVGGMILSDTPISGMVPVRAGAIDGRQIMDWNRDNVADAGFAKIDLLSLPVLDQIEEALDLIEAKGGTRPDLTRIDPEDAGVYDLINAGRCKGVFLLQSPAQLKMGVRLESRNLLDLAYQVALIRPGVGVQGSAVSKFVERYRHGVAWDYDHPLEKRALERGCGIIVWQEQVVQLIMDVAGMSAAQADDVRRAFTRHNSEHLVAMYWQQFLAGARGRGVPEETARKIFDKINGHYMFPESHSHAFAITAFQAAWLKRYHPLEFFVSLMNNQPMGFYPLESLKQDARSFGVPFLNPCVNRSEEKCLPENGALRLGLRFIRDVGPGAAKRIVGERQRHGVYGGAADLVQRTGIRPQALLSLVRAGALDATMDNRRQALWDAGLALRPAKGQRAFPLSAGDDLPQFADFNACERMAGEYRVMDIFPGGHVMQYLRPTLGPDVLPTTAVEEAQEGAEVLVAGWAIARQHPKGRDGTIFVTIEDEEGDVQVILWPRVYERYRREMANDLILLRGVVDRWDGTTNVIVSEVQALEAAMAMPAAHDWH